MAGIMSVKHRRYIGNTAGADPRAQVHRDCEAPGIGFVRVD